MPTTVNVEIYGPFDEIAGARRAKVELGEPTIRGLVDSIERRWGPSFTRAIMDEGRDEFNLSVLVLVNHKPVSQLQGLETPLNEGDTIVFIPPAAGGSLLPSRERADSGAAV